MRDKIVRTTLRRMEREVFGNPFTRSLFDRDISVIIPDTCAIIDLQSLTRDYKGEEERYSDPRIFLDNLRRENRRILVSEGIVNEILLHKDIKVNNNLYEIHSDFVDYIQNLYRESAGFFANLRYGADSEQVGLEVYWASKYACLNNSKKKEECFSDTDKEVLKIACLVGTSTLEGLDLRARDISLVHILSSDEHLLRGVEFMRENFGYSNVNCVDSKY